MDPILLIAQDVPVVEAVAHADEPSPSGPGLFTEEFWLTPPTRVFDSDVDLAPVVAIPALLLVVLLAGLALGKLGIGLLRRITRHTQTTVDDAFVDGIHRLLRPLILLLALHLLVQAFARGETETLAARILMAISIVVVAWGLVAMSVRMVDAWVVAKPEARPLSSPVKLGVKIAAAPIVLLMVLQTFHVPVATLITTLGIGGLAVGLALQDTLKNIFSGIQIVMDQPFRAGDFIVVDEQTKGTVYEIGLRSTKVRTLDNNMLIIPNATIANANVVNTDTFEAVYLHRIWVGVGYDSDSRRVTEVLLDEIDQATAAMSGVLRDRNEVLFMEFGDSALLFRVTVGFERFAGHVTGVSELHHRIHARLAREGIEIPFPMRTVVLRSEEEGPLVRVRVGERPPGDGENGSREEPREL